MDFEISEEGKMIEDQIVRFLEDKIIPAEQTIATESQDTPNGEDTKTMKKLRDEAKGLGLWNLYLPDKEWGAGVSNLDYSLLCEHMGRSQIAPRVFNCQAPDTGNAEIIAEFGSTEQKAQFLQPLLSGEARSCFSMTEPDTSGADPTGLRTNAVKQGDDYIINGHKWFTSGAVGAHFAIAMVVTNPKGNPHQRTSMLLVPTNTPGFDLIRPVSVMGHTGGGGHCEIQYKPRRGLARGEYITVCVQLVWQNALLKSCADMQSSERAMEVNWRTSSSFRNGSHRPEWKSIRHGCSLNTLLGRWIN